MTINLTTTQVQERLTVTLTCASAASLPSATIVVDGKAHTGIWISGFYVFSYDIALERGSHSIYAQATDSGGTVTTNPIVCVMAYELTDYGIDLFSSDAKLDAFNIVLHDALLPNLPTLNFACAALLSGAIGVVIRERGLRQYQFTVITVNLSNGLYQYVCDATEKYALTSAILALQTAYGSTANAIRLIVPSLNIVDMRAWVGSTVNLISNSTFETNIDGWIGVVGAILSRETAAPLAGTGSLKILNTIDNGQTSTPITTIPGHQYLVTCRAKSTAAAGRGSCLIATTGGDIFGEPVDCSTEATLTLIFTSAAVSKRIIAMLSGGAAGESLVIDSVVCYDLTIGGNVNLLEQTTYPQTYRNIQPVDVIDQLMIQALAQASVRNGNLYAYPLDVSAQIPDSHMQRLVPFTGWQRDDDIYGAVVAHYIVGQYPLSDTVLTLNDAGNWTGTVTDVTEVATTLLPPPSGARGMLHANGNISRAGLNTLFQYFDRIECNWNPVTATSVTISLQQDANNKLELTHTFAGQTGCGFILNTGIASTDVLTKNIALSPVQYVTQVTGTTTANCSYRVTLLNAGGAVIWQDVWRNTIGDTFEVDAPTNISQATTVRIEFTDLYLIEANYGVQAITCVITVQTWSAVGSHDQIVSSTSKTVAMAFSGSDWGNGTAPTLLFIVPTLTGSQWYEVIPVQPTNTTCWLQFYINFPPITGMPRQASGWGLTIAGPYVYWYVAFGGIANYMLIAGGISATLIIHETITDYAWVSSVFAWSAAFNLFESISLPLNMMVRTGNPVTLQAIVLTFSGDNYLDTLTLVADNPVPITVQAGTGRPFVVTDDFGSQAGALAYANGLLPIVSVPREEYTRDVSLATDLSVGDTVSGDGVNYTVYAVDYRPDGKTIAAGRAMDTLVTRLQEQARRLDILQRQV
jgi:hypothetical protein